MTDSVTDRDALTAADPELEQRAINVIRGLCMDGPQAANSGHPGTGMALAPLAHVLWTRTLAYDASAPLWPDRDRFVLSCGHASILLYSMLHLTGYDLSLEDLRQFRQWGSATPGHPEVHHTPGVEVTTGPLGQGLANAVGLTLAERYLRAQNGPELVDHRTYVIASDGDLMEGLSHEACSFAGHQGLGRLVAVYDDNHISIDGDTELSYSDDAVKRFEAYGWHVEDLGEMANDVDALTAAIERAEAEEDRPSLLVLRSHIGYPSPKFTDSEAAHGSPLGDDEIRITKELMGLPPDETFHIPDDVAALYRAAGARGAQARTAWETRLGELDADTRDSFDRAMAGHAPEGWAEGLPTWPVGEKVATRKASGACFQAATGPIEALVGGGADLTGNTGTALKDLGTMTPAEPGGRQIHWGVREHGMGAIMNGMALHGGTIPVGGTFFIFSDYCKPAIRLSAMSEAKVIWSFTHDSVGLGEDGPTHQPIEHLPALRAIPGLRVIRPADANETAAAWRVAVDGEGATALILSRQDLPVVTTPEQATGVLDGGYILAETGRAGEGAPDGHSATDPWDLDIVLIGTGSEVQLCLEAKGILEAEGLLVRVVSLPSWDLFELLDDDAQDAVIPGDAPTLAVEAASGFGWGRFADDVVSIDRFGASAPGAVALENLGFTAEHVAERARTLLEDLDAAELGDGDAG